MNTIFFLSWIAHVTVVAPCPHPSPLPNPYSGLYSWETGDITVSSQVEKTQDFVYRGQGSCHQTKDIQMTKEFSSQQDALDFENNCSKEKNVTCTDWVLEQITQ